MTRFNASVAAPLFRKPRKVSRFNHGAGMTPQEYMTQYRPDLAAKARPRTAQILSVTR